jgi:hypothetical protein
MTHNRYGPPRQAAHAYSAEDPEGPDSAPDVLSSVAGVSDKPSLAYLKDHVVRLAGGIACRTAITRCARSTPSSTSKTSASCFGAGSKQTGVLASRLAAAAMTASNLTSKGGIAHV